MPPSYYFIFTLRPETLLASNLVRTGDTDTDTGTATATATDTDTGTGTGTGTGTEKDGDGDGETAPTNIKELLSWAKARGKVDQDALVALVRRVVRQFTVNYTAFTYAARSVARSLAYYVAQIDPPHNNLLLTRRPRPHART